LLEWKGKKENIKAETDVLVKATANVGYSHTLDQVKSLKKKIKEEELIIKISEHKFDTEELSNLQGTLLAMHAKSKEMKDRFLEFHTNPEVERYFENEDKFLKTMGAIMVELEKAMK